MLVPQTLSAAGALLDGRDPGLPLAEGYPHADTFDGLRMFVEHGRSDDDGGWWITLRQDGRVVGDCGTLGWTDDEGQVEIGYGLAEPFRGQGLGTAAVAALVGWLETEPDVTALVASVEVGNEPSRRLLLKLGFGPLGESEGHWRFRRLNRRVGGTDSSRRSGERSRSDNWD